MGRRVLAIGLDGLEISYAQELMDAGKLPSLAALRKRSTTYLLDHGSAQRTGLAWEHVASGLSPEVANRWSAVEFNPANYEVWQEGARFAPLFESLGVRTVVFDPPYVNLKNTTQLQGIVSWGAHDPGTALAARPHKLQDELRERFGNYPSSKWIYACPCYSAEKCKRMGDALVDALQVRRQAAKWLISEKFQDWDLFFVVTGELHSAIEGLWHGIDPQHPLHVHQSAPAAAAALLKVYQATDQLIGELIESVGDADVVAFSMGGMGSNQSDLQSMVLLPELLYRHAFRQPFLKVPSRWSSAPEEVPQLAETEDWNISRRSWFLKEDLERNQQVSFIGKLINKLQKVTAKRLFVKLPKSTHKTHSSGIKWQPATAYRPWWPQMCAFALPSFYDGKIRINLVGREKSGIVLPEDYEKTCSELEEILRQCRDPRTGRSVISRIERPKITDPLKLDTSDADMTIVWSGITTAFIHPEHGLVGPVPFRRTGGHTGPYGVAFITASGIKPGFQGIQSSFNVVPTIMDLLGVSITSSLSGKSLLEERIVSKVAQKV